MCHEMKAGFARFFAGKCTVEHTNGGDYLDPTHLDLPGVKTGHRKRKENW